MTTHAEQDIRWQPAIECGLVPPDQRKDGHTIRVPKHQRWDAFVENTGRRDSNPTSVVNQFMAWYNHEPGSVLPQRPPKKTADES